MSSLTCSEVREAATEYALGILPIHEARIVSDHLLVCPECQHEVYEIRQVGDRLLELIPGSEPPLGFDHKVLSRIAPRRPPRRRRGLHATFALAAAAIATGAIVAAVSLGGPSHGPRVLQLAAAFRAGGHDVGSIHIGGNPVWTTMTVQHVPATGRVTCQLVESDGDAWTIGAFQLVDGNGTWDAPDPIPPAQLARAQLVGPGGKVIAIAEFRPGKSWP
jgi:hypothetical protein